MILRYAADIASVHGLDAVSLGRIAKSVELSKSGVFTLFGSKEALQLATIRTATDTFSGCVVKPALMLRPGRQRLWALCLNWVEYSRSRVFPGGCFFFAVSAEFDARPGRVRDALAEANQAWITLLTRMIDECRRTGEISGDVDAAQLSFEINALLDGANAASVLHDDDSYYDKALAAISARIERPTA